MILDGSNGVTFNDSSLQGAAASPYVLKNRIINGAMVVDQRNAGASVTAADGVYTLDRWVTYTSQASKFTVQQNAGSVTPPLGYTNYLGITSSSSYSAVSGDYFGLAQFIEGYNVSDLSWGTASAQIITLSFWVRSSLTGTFGVSLANSANSRSYLATYTISSANTWEQKTLTITGDTSGTWVTNNGKGIRVWFDLGSGSSYNGTAGSWGASVVTRTSGSQSVVGTSGATFYITGVQLEQNTSATPFERRLYNQELANCQRYFLKLLGYIENNAPSGSNAYSNWFFKVSMRAAPTVTNTGGTGSLQNITQDYVTSVNSTYSNFFISATAVAEL
jgi:hypothetical protein